MHLERRHFCEAVDCKRALLSSRLEATTEVSARCLFLSVGVTLTPKIVSPGKDVRSSTSVETTKTSSSSSGSIKTSPEARLKCAAIDWFSPSMVTAELRKYESDDDKIPKDKEDQLELLMQKFKVDNLKATYYIIAGKIGANEDSVLLPYNAGAKIVIPTFIAMIYDHRSMMYDHSKDAIR
jgi:hypothetical protein